MNIIEFDEEGNQIQEKNMSFNTKIQARITEIITQEFRKDYLDNEDCQIVAEEMGENELQVFFLSSKGMGFCKITYSCNGPKPKIIQVENI